MLLQRGYFDDLCFTYALLPFNQLSTKWNMAMCMLCFGSALKLLSYTTWGDGHIIAPHSLIDSDNEWNSSYVGSLQNGTFSKIAQSNLGYGMKTKMDFQLGFMGRFCYTFGYFLIGKLFSRSGIVKNTDKFTDYRKRH